MYLQAGSRRVWGYPHKGPGRSSPTPLSAARSSCATRQGWSLLSNLWKILCVIFWSAESYAICEFTASQSPSHSHRQRRQERRRRHRRTSRRSDFTINLWNWLCHWNSVSIRTWNTHYALSHVRKHGQSWMTKKNVIIAYQYCHWNNQTIRGLQTKKITVRAFM